MVLYFPSGTNKTEQSCCDYEAQKFNREKRIKYNNSLQNYKTKTLFIYKTNFTLTLLYSLGKGFHEKFIIVLT